MQPLLAYACWRFRFLLLWGKMCLGLVTRSLLSGVVVWRSGAENGLAVVSYTVYPSI